MVKPSDISPNPHNPRLIFDASELDELRESINKVGILVPITIYINKKSSPKTNYILLDGERRWRCATDLGLSAIPANIIDEPKDVTQNILFMFNIHHYRRDWALFPTALKLELLIKQLQIDNEKALSNFTGVSPSMIRRCKALLWFPTKYRSMLMEKGGKVSTDFFIEIHAASYRLSQEAEYYFPEGIEKFIDTCMSKFLNGFIVDVKEFRDIRKCMAFYDSHNDFDKFKQLISEFVTKKKTGLEIFAVPDIENDTMRKNIIKYVSYLNENCKSINPELLSDVIIMDQLKTLNAILEELIEKID
jgi:ParB family transcriptional regulator, chromosome partitioning protein